MSDFCRRPMCRRSKMLPAAMPHSRRERGRIMRRWMIFVGSLAGLCLLLVSASADEKGKKPESETKQRLTPAGQILGEITKLDESGKSFTLRIHEKTPQINYNNSFQRPG